MKQNSMIILFGSLLLKYVDTHLIFYSFPRSLNHFFSFERNLSLLTIYKTILSISILLLSTFLTSFNNIQLG